MENNHRQLGIEQLKFRDFLDHVREGKCVPEDWTFIQDRIRGNVESEDDFDNALYLQQFHKDIHEFNLEKIRLNALINPSKLKPCRIIAAHLNKKSKDIDDKKFRGLKNQIVLAREAKVMLTTNLWTTQGLTNGATGIVKDIIYKKGQGPPKLPEAVIVRMDEPYNGPHLIGLPRHVAVPFTTGQYKSEVDGYCERTQFPIALAYAVTFFKCQGMTLNKVRINFGKSDFKYGSAYVGFSRSKTKEGLLIDTPFPENRLLNIRLPFFMLEHDRTTTKLIEETKQLIETEENLPHVPNYFNQSLNLNSIESESYLQASDCSSQMSLNLDDNFSS